MIISNESESPEVPVKDPINGPPSNLNAPNQSSEEPPPSYSSTTDDDPVTGTTNTGDITSGSSAAAPRFQNGGPGNLAIANMLNTTRSNGSIKGAWLVDPTMTIPRDLLPPLPEGETEQDRKNVLLQTRNGAVDVDLFVLSVSKSVIGQQKIRERVLLEMNTRNGEINARVHEITSAGDIRLPIRLQAYSANGAVNIYVPRSFRGLMQLTTANGSVKMSDAVHTQMHIFSEIQGVQRCFLGLFDAADWTGSDRWTGDEIVAETKNGNVRVFFDDEATTGWGKARPQGWLDRLFAAFT